MQAAQASLNADGTAIDPREIDMIHPNNSPQPHAHPSAIVDSSCKIGKNVEISPFVTIGSYVTVQNNVNIPAGVTCDDEVFLGSGMVFSNIFHPREAIHHETYIRKGVTIGSNATILIGIELGEYCFVSAGTVVTENVKPYALMNGNPGKQIGWISRHGKRLKLPVKTTSEETLTAVCPRSKEVYVLSKNALSIRAKVTVS